MQLKGSTLPLYPPPPADPTLRPADALLRESDPGQSQYSPQTQHQEIVAAMARNGHYPACIDGDERKGHIAARRGYQNIKARVDAGLTTAVYVVHSSRLGRDASERLALQRALKKLKVPIYSCQQGEIAAGLIGGVYALMDEQFSVDLAYKIKNAMPQAVKAGRYPARTPVGYRRVWPQSEDAQSDRKARRDMVIDEQYGPLVLDIFRKYGRGGWSMRAIVGALNEPGTLPNPNSANGLWNVSWVGRILRNAVYIGEIEWGRHKTGYYDHYDGPILRSGDDDLGVGPARHEPLIDRELWGAVQMRLKNEDPRRTTTTRKGRTPALLSGVLVCRSCSGPMRALHTADAAPGRRQYVCVARERKQSPCSEPGCVMHLANAAVLREVARLRPGRPWTPSAPDDLGRDPHADARAQIGAQIGAARREVEANNRLLRLLALSDEGDPGQEAIDAFRRDQLSLDRRIKELQAQLEALPRHAVDPIEVEELHARLAGADLQGRIAAAQAAGNTLALRELVAVTVQSACMTERRGGARNGRTGWAQAEVVWTAEVALLLEHGYLLLDAPEEAPPATSVAERMQRAAERMRRYRARHRTQREAQQRQRVQERAQELEEADLLTVAAAAAELGVTPDALRRAIMRGVLVPVRVGRRTLLPRAEVERYRTEHLGRRGPRRGATP